MRLSYCFLCVLSVSAVIALTRKISETMPNRVISYHLLDKSNEFRRLSFSVQCLSVSVQCSMHLHRRTDGSLVRSLISVFSAFSISKRPPTRGRTTRFVQATFRDFGCPGGTSDTAVNGYHKFTHNKKGYSAKAVTPRFYWCPRRDSNTRHRD